MDRASTPLGRGCSRELERKARALLERTRFALRPALAACLLVVTSCVTQPPETSGVVTPPRAPAATTPTPKRNLAGPPGRPAAAVLPGAAPHIALLLPLSGRQAAAAATIRDGFLTAYYVSPSTSRPRLRLYDTGSQSVAEAVDSAMRAGALFIVGPLTREEVVAAAQLPQPHPPILALNFLPAGAGTERPGGFYQFALSPEDEARDVAQRILADGHHRGVAVVPDGEWGTRVLAAFREGLTMGGGTLLAAARFDPEATSYQPAITEALRIDESTARYKRIEELVGGKLEFQPRRRGDIEFIFAPSSAPIARLLTPQLKYFFAGNLPTYATSEAYEPNPTADEDLEGLELPIMPWMLGSGLSDSVRLAASGAWPAGGPPRDRLFAFGFDAYRLTMALRAAPAPVGGQAPSASSISIEGLTGDLTIDASGRVHRGLDWAEVHDGQPRPLPAPQAAQRPPGGQGPAGPAPSTSGSAPAPAAAPSGANR